MPAGEPCDYRVLTSRGAETSQSVVAEGTEVAENGLVVEASYSFAGTPPDGQDVNGDGAVDAADGEFAAQVSDDAKDDVDPSQGRPLPITGGAALAVLLAVIALGVIVGTEERRGGEARPGSPAAVDQPRTDYP